MIINVRKCEEERCVIERIKAEVIEFSVMRPGYLVVNEGEMIISIDDVISIRK